MTNKTLSELLILLLLLISNSRFIYIKNVRSDAISVLPAVALILSILSIFAWGVSLTEMILVLLSLFTFIWNFRALLRLASHLVIDHYGIGFILISAFNLILCIGALVFVLFFAPVYTNLKKFNVQTTTQHFTGNFGTGFQTVTHPFQKKTASFYTWQQIPAKNQPQEEEYDNGAEPQEEARKIILFLMPRTADTETYAPFFAKLAHDGFTVYAGSFFTDDSNWFEGHRDWRILRRRFSILQKKNDERNGTSEYQDLIQSKGAEYRKELAALYDYADPQPQDLVFLAGDGEGIKAIEQYYNGRKKLISGWYDIATSTGYTTPGYGPIEQTDPLLASSFGLKRDKTRYMASHIATCLEESIKDWIKVMDILAM